ncbi:MAG: branched-chain amino acid ABC transporter permease [Mycobacteriales bacterium]|nr:branched-chain amino acid ABC transporter permease [Frankia sp.]
MSPALTLALAYRDQVLTPFTLGIIQGCVYGLVGLGLVILYKSNRIFNFAQGEFGSVAALIAFYFITGRGIFPDLPTWLAIVLGIAAGTLTALVTERLVVRPLFHQPKVVLVVATAGVALLLINLELLYNGPNLSVFPASTQKPWFSLFGTLTDPHSLKISYQRVIILGVLIVLAALTALFFRYTPFGTAILAVSQEPTAASVVGVNVNQISALTWGLAGFLGATAGILLAPISSISPGFMTLGVLIPGFTAAVVGGITSLPGAFVGGLVIGVVEQFANLIPRTTVPGANRVGVALVLLIVLLVRPSGLLGKEV